MPSLIVVCPVNVLADNVGNPAAVPPSNNVPAPLLVSANVPVSALEIVEVAPVFDGVNTHNEVAPEDKIPPLMPLLPSCSSKPPLEIVSVWFACSETPPPELSVNEFNASVPVDIASTLESTTLLPEASVAPYSLVESGRQIEPIVPVAPPVLSVVAKDVPMPVALPSTSAQGRMPLFVEPVAPVPPTNVTPVVVVANVAVPASSDPVPRLVPRTRNVAPVGTVPMLATLSAEEPPLSVMTLAPASGVKAPKVSLTLVPADPVNVKLPPRVIGLVPKRPEIAALVLSRSSVAPGWMESVFTPPLNVPVLVNASVPAFTEEKLVVKVTGCGTVKFKIPVPVL